MWGLAYWWTPMLPIGGRWNSGRPVPTFRPRLPVNDAQLVQATIDGNSVVLDCLTSTELITLRARLPRKAIRRLRATVDAWKRSAGWVGVTTDRDGLTAHVASDELVIDLQLLPR